MENKNNNILKRALLITAMTFIVVGNVCAQKKLAKKSVPLKIPKPIVTKQTIPDPPSRAEVFKNSVGYPKIAIAPSDDKFEKEKICTTCDTLVLEPGKPHIVIYDIKWMADSEAKTYNKQPTAYDLTNSYFAMDGLVKREWDELHQNYPDTEISYHHVYRNTFITTPNSTQENVNLLNRINRYEGFVYWSGNPTDKLLQSTKMALATEQISKVRGDGKISSYAEKFKKDSLFIENLMKTSNPATHIKANMNVFLQQILIHEYVLPFQFMDLKNVSKITINTAPNKKLVFKFNKSGQLVTYEDGDKDVKMITYKDDLPFFSDINAYRTHTFNYRNDTVSVDDNYNLKAYKLIDKVFLLTNQFSIEKQDYQNLDIKGINETRIVQRNGETCLVEIDNKKAKFSTCYSNNQWSLPLTISKKYADGDLQTKTYSLNANNELIAEEFNDYKSTKMTYKIENGLLKSMQYSEKKTNQEEYLGNVMPVTYEFFK